MLLTRPQTNTQFLPPPRFMGDGVKGSEQDIPPSAPVRQPLPPPQYVDNGVKGSEQYGYQSPEEMQQQTLDTPISQPAATLPPPKTLLQQSEENFNALQAQKTPPDNDKGFLRRLGATLREFGKRALQSGGAAGPNASMSERLWGMFGGGLAGAAGYQFDPQVDERENLQNQRSKAWRDYQVQNAMEKTRQEQARTAAQTQTIYNDDANKRLEIENKQQEGKEKLRTQALSKLVGLKHFDLKNPVHLDLAKQAGQDTELLKGWDDRNPFTKLIAGTTYQYNRQTGVFEPSGLPVDSSKTLTDYVVKMPTGEMQTFKVPQEKAAQFATQFQTLGMQIEAANNRQISQQTFSAEQSEKTRQDAMRKYVTENKIGWAKFQTDLLQKVSEGRLTQEDADKAAADFPQEFK